MSRQRSDDREFISSLRLLVCREEYSFVDIGMMFGVTRERVRQWCVMHNIEHPRRRADRGLMNYRAWDDTAHRFRPVSRGEWNTRLGEMRARKKLAARKRRQGQRQTEIVNAATTLKRKLHRDPTLLELAKVIFGECTQSGAGARLAARWDSSRQRTRDRYAALVRGLMHAGVNVRSVGAPGHVPVPERAVWFEPSGTPLRRPA